MKQLFEKLNNSEFYERFNTEDACLKFLSELKWKAGYKCRKCGNANYCAGKTAYSRRCTRCKTEESATAHTMFHRCRISLPDAFRITYLVCNKPGISSYKLSDEINLRHMTCWKFKKKILSCIESNASFTASQKAEFKRKIME